MKLVVTKFLNTFPLIWELEHIASKKGIELIKETPAECAFLLLNDKVEGGVVPVTTYAYKQELLVLLNPCVASRNFVRTVKLYSNKPINEVYEVIVDQDSRTSVVLLKILLSIRYKKHKLTFIREDVSKIRNINNDFGYLMIGDKNFSLMNKFKYQYDLAAEWAEWVNLPFIFASWMISEGVDSRRASTLLKRCYITAKRNIEQVCEEASFYWNLPVEDVRKYFEENISFEVGLEGVKAIKLFFEMANELKLLPKVRRVNFIDV